MAASIASDGDFESGRGSLLLSMVMRFSDLQDLESAFSDIDADAVRAQLESAGGSEWAGLFDDVHTLDTGDLGDHAMGVGMTMDLASLFGSVAEALGGATGTPVAIPSGVPTGFSIDMYIFARGSYAGALMRVFTSGARPLDELALARVVDGRLSAAD
jgi:hypothetical protein